jgi:hypothetical protein
MGLRRFLKAFGSVLAGRIRARGIKARLFSGSAVLKSISILDGMPPAFSLVYPNGLMLTLGEAGILDYQDAGFREFMGGPGRSLAPDNREFLIHLHKIVLKSLLRYITHPGLALSQRELAAEAASKLWLAAESRPEDAPAAHPWTVSPRHSARR